jgi:hypothetical protein
MKAEAVAVSIAGGRLFVLVHIPPTEIKPRNVFISCIELSSFQEISRMKVPDDIVSSALKGTILRLKMAVLVVRIF